MPTGRRPTVRQRRLADREFAGHWLDLAQNGNQQSMYTITGGFDGTIAGGGFLDGWNYTGYAQYGKTPSRRLIPTMAIRTGPVFPGEDAVAILQVVKSFVM